MIAGLKSYPVMKDSGVEWLGEVPEHWDVLPNRALFDEIKQRGHPDEDMLSVTIKQGVIRQAALLADSSKKDNSNLDKSNYKLVLPGDIAYNKMRAWQGAIGASVFRGIISPAYVVQRPTEGGKSSYFNNLFRIPSFAKEAERWSYGITSDMWSLRPEHFKLIYSCRPPVAEQAAIVRYLDHMDRRVRRLVRAKRKLIALLTEQKQAIVHRAVTRGLDPDVPLKDSGVEWLGEVPAHWAVMLLGRALTGIGQGWSPVAAEGDISPDQWAVLTLSSVKKGRFDPGAIKPVSVDAKIPGGIELYDGDLLLTRSNTRELVGDACIVTGVRPRTVMCDLIYRLVPDQKSFEPSFLMYQLLSRVGRRQIEQDARGSSGTMPKISQRHIRGWRVIRPPLGEQERICSYIVDASERIDSAIGRAGEEINLLTEYRTRLTADVVTGKLDVREAAAALPEVDPLSADDGPDTLDVESETDPEELEAIAEEDEA